VGSSPITPTTARMPLIMEALMAKDTQVGKIEFHDKFFKGGNDINVTAKLFMLENQIKKQGKQIAGILKRINNRKKGKGK
jgi:hypothetical protein